MIANANDLDAINYQNGTKNNWRRRSWNVIADAVPSKRGAIVLYLPGGANLDMRVALEHGFRRANMIAVERDKKVEKYSLSVLDARLGDVMCSWPDRPTVSVVVADMVCGCDKEALGVPLAWLGSKAFSGATLLLNVMRGRETTAFYKNLAKHRYSAWWPEFAARYGVDEKHRGLIAVTWIHFMYARMFCGGDNKLARTGDNDCYERWKISLIPGYRSTSGQYFDTLIATDLHRDDHRRVSWKVAADHPGLTSAEREEIYALNRRINAVLAVRTMRLS